jgi:hypothetical protein
MKSSLPKSAVELGYHRRKTHENELQMSSLWASSPLRSLSQHVAFKIKQTIMDMTGR